MNGAASDITAVIATVGEDSLSETIEKLLKGTVQPDLILVCIPKTYANRITKINKRRGRVRVIETEFQGQVAQRAFGFAQVQTTFTLQIDSDTFVEERCLEHLLFEAKKHEHTVIAPTLHDAETGKALGYLTPESKMEVTTFQKMIYWIMNGDSGFKEGTISKAGVGFGIKDPTIPTIVEWFPGCCALHRTANLIIDNFYRFEGKAYCEDLFHSTLLRENSLQIYIADKAKVSINAPRISLQHLLIEEYMYIRATVSFVKWRQLSILRFFVFRLILLLSKACNRLRF